MNEGFPGHDAGPLVELEFHALFDDEHGLSVLTDGRSVLGIGANGNVLPFGWKPPAAAAIRMKQITRQCSGPSRRVSFCLIPEPARCRLGR